MDALDKEAVRAYRQRWQAVAEIELHEQRAASMELRWRQLNAIVGMAFALGLQLRSPNDDHEEEVVRRRWNALKDRLT